MYTVAISRPSEQKNSKHGDLTLNALKTKFFTVNQKNNNYKESKMVKL